MQDAIDELVARSKDHPKLRAFHQLHRSHPEVLDFLVSEIQLRIDHGFETFSFRSLWEYARWKLEMGKGPGETFLMSDTAVPYFARAITVLHPEFNGRAEFRKSNADAVFGLEMDRMPDSSSDVRRVTKKLCWLGGVPLAAGWRPTRPHVVQNQGKRRPNIH